MRNLNLPLELGYCPYLSHPLHSPDLRKNDVEWFRCNLVRRSEQEYWLPRLSSSKGWTMWTRLCYKKPCNLPVCIKWSWKEKWGLILRSSWYCRMAIWTCIPKNILDPGGAQPCVNWGNIDSTPGGAGCVSKGGCAVVFAQWLVVVIGANTFLRQHLSLVLSCNIVMCGAHFHILCGSLIVKSLFSEDFFLCWLCQG